MSIWNQYPYTDFHELNLDWIIKMVKEVTKELNDFKVVNRITWGGLHDPGKEYPRFCIVDTPTHEGYISIQPVPAGITINNEDYWRQVANYSALYADFQNRIVALETKMSNLNVYNILDYAGAGDGTTDNTTAFNDLVSLIGIKSSTILIPDGEYLIDGSVTIPENITLLFNGGVVKISATGALNINGCIDAERLHIFDVIGTLTVNNAKTPIGFPEWFGAVVDDNTADCAGAIALCCELFSKTELTSGDYYIKNTIVIEKSNRVVSGISPLNWTYEDSTKKGTRIITTDLDLEMLRIGTTSVPSGINLSTQNVTIKDFTLYRIPENVWHSNSIGVRFVQALRCSAYNVSSMYSDMGFYVAGCTGVTIEKCRVFVEMNATTVTNTFRGILLDNSVLSANNIPNVSIYLTDNAIGTGGGHVSDSSYGIAVYASTGNCADLFFNGNNIEWVAVAIYIEGNSGSMTSNDIHISNTVADVIKSNGLLLTNLGRGGQIKLTGNYIAPYAGSDATFHGIALISCEGVSISNNEFVCKNHATSTAIFLSSCKCVDSFGNLIGEVSQGVYLENSEAINIEDCITNIVRSGSGIVASAVKHCYIAPSITGDTNKIVNGIYLVNDCSKVEANVSKLGTGVVSGCEVYVNSQYATAVGVLNGCLVSGIM